MPRYKTPKILLIDLPTTIAERLNSLGFSAVTGTYGQPYKASLDGEFEAMGLSADLPGFAEHDILFIDLAMPAVGNSATASVRPVLGEKYWVVKRNRGWIDPRPKGMLYYQSDCDRIIQTGGLVVVFAAPRVKQTILHSMRVSWGYQHEQDLPADNWSFSSMFVEEDFLIGSDAGSEIRVEPDTPFTSFMARHLGSATYDATITSLKSWNYSQTLLAVSKFGDPVACVISREEYGGNVLILPQFDNKEAVIVELVRDTLPNLFPTLFPDHEGMKWVHRAEYEHPSVMERRERQREIREKAKADIESLESEITAEAERWSFLHELLRESGDNLVKAVKRALEQIGFTQVRNVDEENPDVKNKQEDLQIHDRSPCLLAEVKGIGGLPTEGDTLQIIKYVARRMKNWQRFDVQGFSIINAQRNLPPLERDHAGVFTTQQVADAENHSVGLITTWELFRLIRGMIRWGWPPSAVQQVFYKIGRIIPIPTHYTPVGEVGHFYTDKQALRINVADGCTIGTGERLGFAFEDEFYEEVVESLHIERRVVGEAGPNAKVGHQTNLTRSDVPVGTIVYKVG